LPLRYKSLKIMALLLFLQYNPLFTTKRAGFYRPFFLVDCFSMLRKVFAASFV
jgi:hypothetical protein